MIALDTNVLVRFLVEDDPEQTARAASFFEDAGDRGEEIFLAQIVAAETVWVLEGSYGLARGQVFDVLTALFRTRQLTLEDGDDLWRALDAYGKGKGDFADYLIREGSRRAGAGTVVTFDADLLADAGFSAP